MDKCDKWKEIKDMALQASLYDDPALYPDVVLLDNLKSLRFYKALCQKILRLKDKLKVIGKGSSIATVCTLVQLLEKTEIAEITRAQTGFNVSSFFDSQKNEVGRSPLHSQPLPMITFVLKRGKFGEYITEYQQPKIIQLFEMNDHENTGFLRIDTIKSFKLSERFKANKEQKEKAINFLQFKGLVNLPTFIKYASILIHPLLKKEIFDSALESFNIH